MLVRLPFDVDGDTNHGTVWIDPGEVACVSRGFDRVVLLLKSGQVCASRQPKMAIDVVGPSGLHGTPDNATLDKWMDDTIDLINGSSRRKATA